MVHQNNALKSLGVQWFVDHIFHTDAVAPIFGQFVCVRGQSHDVALGALKTWIVFQTLKNFLS